MSDPQSPKPLALEECFPTLLQDQRVLKLANEILGGGAQRVLELMKEPEPFSHVGLAEFHDAVIDLLGEAEYLDSAEIECLSSYSTTSSFDLMMFAGVFFVQNLEHGNIGYFLSAETAKKAAEELIGFKWDDPGAFSFDSKADEL